MRARNITGVEWMVGIALTVMLAFLAFGALTTVRGWAVKSGVVDAKDYHPAWTDYHTTGGQNAVSIPVVHPESYTVTIAGRTAEGEERNRILHVDQITFHAVKVGQKWTEKGGFQ